MRDVQVCTFMTLCVSSASPSNYVITPTQKKSVSSCQFCVGAPFILPKPGLLVENFSVN